MKKFFAFFTLLLSLIPTYQAFSGVNSISSPPKKTQVDIKSYNKQLENLYKELPDYNNKQEVEKYLKKRLSIITEATEEEKANLASPESTSIVDLEELNQKQKQTLTAYEQIYSQSMERASNTDRLDEDVKLEGTFYREKEVKPDAPFVPDFPYVTIKLSEDREIMAPAEEHIAYFLTTIKIEKLGLINVTESITFVSNNEGFPQGFFRILPKYTYSRFGKRRRIDLSLQSVTINKEPYPYKVTEIGNYLHIEPKNPISLPTGIYTYEFNYIIDRSIWQYSNYDEFYWDITARTIKNVIGSANALVMLPEEETFLAQNATANTLSGLEPERVTITNITPNVLGFADTEALAVGEDIHLLLTLHKNTLITPSPIQKYLWFIQDYGKEFFLILVLLALYISYKISLKQIYRNLDKTKAQIKKTPSIWRMINKNTFDLHSLGSEILNLCSKNILELSSSENKVVLIKKTDDLRKLTSTEKKFLNHLFPSQETTLNAGKESALKLKRAYNYLHKQTLYELTLYKLKLITSYLISGIIMLVLGFIGSSYLATNFWHTFIVISISTILITPFVFLIQKTFKNRILNYIIKLICLVPLVFIAGFISIYTSKIYAVLIILCIYIIGYYLNLFSRRNGLMRSKIKETEDYKSYLQKNPELNLEARDFNSKAPYIYAFELEDKYSSSPIFATISELINTK